VIEVTGTEDKIDGLLDVLRPYGILEMVRTGRVAMARGPRPAEIDDSPDDSGETSATEPGEA
jgi:acetolactate synthase-1/3 small subunit